MDKKEVIKYTKKLGLPLGSYIVFGGCPLAAFGIRETEDIDIVAIPEVFNNLRNTGKWVEKKTERGNIFLSKGLYEVGTVWDYGEYNPDIQKLIKRAVVFEGVPFAPLEDVLKWKKAFGRPKDLKDLKLIDSYLESHER